MPDREDAFRFFVTPYHPDSLRIPSASPVVDARDRVRHSLTWNVFRTLEQIAPGFWMRPLIAALGGLADDFASAPHVCQVRTWQALSPPPAAMLRRARRAPIRADIIIDTDDTVVALLIPSISEVTDTVLSDTAEGGLLDLIEATSYFAGSRAAYAGVVLPPGIGSDVWIARVRRRCLAVHRVLCASGRGVANARGLGAITWNTLIDILTDASQSPLLHAAERALAHGTVRWMSERLSRDEPRGRLA